MNSPSDKVERMLKTSELPELIMNEAVKKFGNWMHAKLTIEVTPDQIYWLLQLIDQGIKARIDEWTNGGKRKFDVAEALSIGAFRVAAEELAESVMSAIINYKEKKRKKKE